jgi:hypothetical protein
MKGMKFEISTNFSSDDENEELEELKDSLSFLLPQMATKTCTAECYTINFDQGSLYFRFLIISGLSRIDCPYSDGNCPTDSLR